MKAQIKWVDGFQFVGKTESGHSVVMDVSEKHGGHNLAPTPMEMILQGVGGCSSIDVVSTLQKSRQAVSSCHVEIDAERADAVPAVLTKIHMHFVVAGRDLKETHVSRAVELSTEKYCSAAIMLRNGGVEITHSFEVQEV